MTHSGPATSVPVPSMTFSLASSAAGAAAACAADRHRPAADRAGPRDDAGRRDPGGAGGATPTWTPITCSGPRRAGAGPPPAQRGGSRPGRHRQRRSRRARRGQPRDEAPSLTPAAKRALLDARQVAGPSAPPTSAPSTCCSRSRSTPSRPPAGCCGTPASPRRRCRTRPGGPAGAAAGAAGRPPSDTHADPGRVRPRPHRDGPRGPDRPGGRPWPRRSSRRSRCCRGARRTTRC